MGGASGFRRGHGHAVAAVVFNGGRLLASRLMSLRGQAECLAERGHEREGEEGSPPQRRSVLALEF